MSKQKKHQRRALQKEAWRLKPLRIDASSDTRPATEDFRQVVTDAFTVTEAQVAAESGTDGRANRADHAQVRSDANDLILSKVQRAHALGKPGATLRRDTARAKQTRYTRAPVPRSALIKQADRLIAGGVLQQDLGYQGFAGEAPGRLSLITYAPAWLEKIKGMSHLATVTTHVLDELVMLKGTEWRDGVAKDLLEYTDNDTTRRLRAQMKLINAANAHHVAEGRIEWIGELMTNNFLVDPRDTFQRRYFNRGSFESGGRLFGAWWKPLGEIERRRDIRVNGEPVVELDCSAMGVMLAYAHAGATPPSGDLYGPRRFHRGSPGDALIYKPVDLSRETLKKLTNAMLWDTDKGRNHWPRGFENAGKGLSVGTVIAGIQEMHAPIAHLFGTGFGYTGQFMESNIMVETLLRLMLADIPALDVHESIVVAESQATRAKAIFADVFEAHTGLLARIAEKRDETDKLDIAANF